MPGRSLDHVVVAVEDLDTTAGVLERLGFFVTARSDHPFGTSNRLLMLPGVYVELVTVTDAGSLPGSGFARFVADILGSGGSGPVMLVLASADPVADQARLAQRGMPAPEPMRFGRQATLPDGGGHRVEFVSVFTDLGSDVLSAFYCRHLTPEIVWHPDTMVHPNGARRLTSVGVADPGPSAWERLAYMAELDPAPELVLGATTVRAGPPALRFQGARDDEAMFDGWTLTVTP